MESAAIEEPFRSVSPQQGRSLCLHSWTPLQYHLGQACSADWAPLIKMLLDLASGSLADSQLFLPPEPEIKQTQRPQNRLEPKRHPKAIFGGEDDRMIKDTG